MALRVSRGLRASAEGLIWSSGVVGVGMRRLCSAKDNTRRGQQSFVEADKQQDNQLDKFAYAIESHPVHEGIVNITGWGEGSFRVDKDLVVGSLVLFPTFALSWHGVERMEDLTFDHFAIFQYAFPPVELIILGTGKRLKRPRPELYKELLSIAPVEIVDTVNASATFNMLASEGRNVAAGLIAMDSSG